MCSSVIRHPAMHETGRRVGPGAGRCTPLPPSAAGDVGRGVCWCVGCWLAWGVAGSLRGGTGGSGRLLGYLSWGYIFRAEGCCSRVVLVMRSVPSQMAVMAAWRISRVRDPMRPAVPSGSPALAATLALTTTLSRTAVVSRPHGGSSRCGRPARPLTGTLSTLLVRGGPQTRQDLWPGLSLNPAACPAGPGAATRRPGASFLPAPSGATLRWNAVARATPCSGSPTRPHARQGRFEAQS